MGREKYIKQSLGALGSRVAQARVLMVGAGGIGCELLKNLVLTGFGEIHVVDLDTIDLSNLNRQFLFRHEHIKKSKALVAKESAGRFNPGVKIEAYHANIKDAQFDLDWYKRFDVVFNALDNADARRHVNKMCITADIPLVDGGTTGFMGNVRLIKRGVTECYDCAQKDPPKSFPICTIRSTPSQPIHCIVWGKSYLFVEIFGISEDTAVELDETQDTDNKDEIADLKKEQAELKHIRDSMGSEQFPRLVFDKVFKHDVERLRSVEGFWDTRRRPDPLDFDRLIQEASEVNGAECAKRDQDVWSLAENFAVFLDSLKRLSARMAEESAKSSEEGAVLTFDKDDEDTLDFVASSSNLRSHIFGIETHSKFDIKQMAGNIIPAIATTNAIFAGLMVLHAFKVLRGPDSYNKAPMVYSQRSTDRVLSAEKPIARPNPECVVCGVARTTVVVDPSRATMRHVVEDVLKSSLGYGNEFTITSGGEQLYEALSPADEDDDDDEDQEIMLAKRLTELELVDGSAITVRDDSDTPKVDLEVLLSFKELPSDDKPAQPTEVLQIPTKPKRAPPPAVDEVVTNGTNGTLGKRKRPTDETGEEGSAKKKGKMPADDDAVIVLDDDDVKPIEID